MTEEEKITGGEQEILFDTIVSDYHLAEIANDLLEWENLAPWLKITKSEQKEIVEDFQGRYNLQKRQALRVWRWKSGDKATYKTLIDICRSQGLGELAEIIEKYPGSPLQPRHCQILDTFYRYLLDCYLDLPHPSKLQWPSNKSSLPIHAPTTYFDLILYEGPLHEIQYSQERSSSPILKAITLQDILRKGEKMERMLVYFEGTAGSGKTTLSWHACREWAQKKLLKGFQLAIHVQLNDSTTRSATSLEDIIPYPDKKFRHEIATAITIQKGKGVCLILDGLDEAPTELLDFLLDGLIKGEQDSHYLKLPELSLIMTSRPDMRVTKRLESIVSSRILMKGFNSDSLDKYLDDSLGASSAQKAKLVLKFRINPGLKGLCSHPVNAVIMTFLIHFFDKDIPTTQTNLFKLLVTNFLVRHVEKASKDSGEPCAIDNLLEDRCIPLEIREQFRKMCSLAYSSMPKSKRLFTKEEICQGDLDDTLGFLHAHPTITMSGTKRYYSFFHLSLQEFLAAVHLSKLNRCKQVEAIKWFLRHYPRSQVLPFYAGLTRLSNRDALKVMSQTLSQATRSDTIVKEQLKTKFKEDPRQKALAFLSCLFECQNESLLILEETDLPHDAYNEHFVAHKFREAGMLLPADDPPAHPLNLSHLALTPLDCLALGYYIQVKSRMPKSISRKIALYNCSIDELGMRLLFTELKKNIIHHTEGVVHLILTHNKFNKGLLHPLKELVQGQSNLQCLGLRNCFDPSLVDLSDALKYLIEGLSNNSSCGFIDLAANHFDLKHIHHFVLMLRACPQLYCFYAGSYDLSSVMPLFCNAVALTSLRFLDLTECNISDSNLILLGKTICKLRSLVYLKVYSNPFTDSGLSNFLKFFVKNIHSRLTFLGFDQKPSRDHKYILNEINWFRSRLVPPNPLLTTDSFAHDFHFFKASLSNTLLEMSKSKC